MNKQSKMKGVSWFPRDEKWTAKVYNLGKTVFLGYFKEEQDAINKVIDYNGGYRLRNKNELILIKDYINKMYGEEIESPSRKGYLPSLRALYCKIAFNVVKDVTYQEVADVVNRDHSTMMFARTKLIPEIENDIDYMEVYLNYPKVSDINLYNEISLFCKLKKDYEDLFYKNIELQKQISKYKSTTKLTTNELKYRKLSKEQQKDYNFRVEPILRMMNLKERKESDKFEEIYCS